MKRSGVIYRKRAVMPRGKTLLQPIAKKQPEYHDSTLIPPGFKTVTRLPIRETKNKALVYGEGQLGKLDGKVTNGLVRYSEKYEIVGVVDSTKAGLDAGEFLDGVTNGIPVFRDLVDAAEQLHYVPMFFIYGIAPLASYLDVTERGVILSAMKMGMNIVNGLPEFFTEDEEFVTMAREWDVKIQDIRKPLPRKDLHIFTGDINQVSTPIVTVFGTDCAVGKRTSAILLVAALRARGLKPGFLGYTLLAGGP